MQTELTKRQKALQDMHNDCNSALWLYFDTMLLDRMPGYLDDLAKAFLKHYKESNYQVLIQNATMCAFLSGNTELFKECAVLYNSSETSSILLALAAHKKWNTQQ